MGLAWSVTAIAIFGAWVGAFLGQQNSKLGRHLAAAGGGVLFGISLFWLVPEVAETSGLAIALLMVIAIAVLLLLVETAIGHKEHSAHAGVVWPLLLATVIHSLLDGWSVRLISIQPLANIAVTVGLALHKVPEGIALGWITRRALHVKRQAFLLSAGVELFTIVGALAEPGLNASGASHFGLWWSAGVLSVIAGGFLFLALHAMLPIWKIPIVSAIFLASVLLMGSVALLHSPV